MTDTDLTRLKALEAADDLFSDAELPPDLPTQIATEVCGTDAVRKVVTDADQLCAIHGTVQEIVAAALSSARAEIEGLQLRLDAMEEERNEAAKDAAFSLADTRHAEQANEAFRENLQSAWAAMRMVREALETLGPVGALPSEEAVLLLRGPTFHDEAMTLVEAIQSIASARAEGWKTGRDAAAKVASDYSDECHMFADKHSQDGTQARNLRAFGNAGAHLATAILALEEPRHE